MAEYSNYVPLKCDVGSDVPGDSSSLLKLND